MTRPISCPQSGFQSYDTAEDARAVRDAEQTASGDVLTVRCCRVCTWWHVMSVELAVRARVMNLGAGGRYDFDPSLVSDGLLKPFRARDVQAKTGAVDSRHAPKLGARSTARRAANGRPRQPGEPSTPKPVTAPRTSSSKRRRA